MVRKDIIGNIIDKQDIKNVERHLVYSYINTKGLDYSKSAVLNTYFKDFEASPSLYFKCSSLELSSIKHLEQSLELIIPPEDRKLNGAFFTPDFVIDFIINEIAPDENDTNLDPSCGCGAFLIGLTEYYRRKYKKSFKHIYKYNIFGADILKYNIDRTKILLSLFALQDGEIVADEDFNLYQRDSLRGAWEVQFDNVVGNPPYVKFQDLSTESRICLADNWATVQGGTFNLYFAFFELGHKLLNPGGKLGFITPNNYFTSLAGEALRRYFQKHKCVTRIIDFKDKKVFDAQTYTAITFLENKSSEVILFDRIKADYSPEDFLKYANGSPNNLESLNPKKWRLLKSDEQEHIKKIESIGTPIGKLFDIVVGIATLKDDVFFIDSSKEENYCYIKTTLNGTYAIEKACTRPVYKISDFKNQNDVLKNKRRIIFPYYIKGNSAIPIPESDFKVKFPKCYEYLLSEKEQLLNRDKGKVVFDPFFVWGRSQGLTKTGKKIVNPTFSQTPRFLLVDEQDAFFTNGYGIYFKEEGSTMELFSNTSNLLTKIENMDVVQKILNSQIMHYYVSKTSVSIEGGYPCYQKNFIERFSIPNFDEKEINMLHMLTNNVEIDEFLIRKYQLNIPVPNLSL